MKFSIKRWLRGFFKKTRPVPLRTTRHKEWPLGTQFREVSGTYHYGRAGEDLKKGTLVESDLAGRITPEDLPFDTDDFKELIWGNLKAIKEVDPAGTNVLGWPERNIKRYQYFWLREVPLGAKFVKDEEPG